MPRKPRQLLPGYSYHITCRCNNREFRLTRLECRQVFLFALKKVLDKFRFKLYALCIMSNHVHYLLEPQEPQELPKIMHWLNWYTAMCFNRMLKRTGHFWEKRYYCNGFPSSDREDRITILLQDRTGSDITKDNKISLKSLLPCVFLCFTCFSTLYNERQKLP